MFDAARCMCTKMGVAKDVGGGGGGAMSDNSVVMQSRQN